MKKKLQQLYYILPNGIKNAILSLLLFKQRNLRYGTYYIAYLTSFRNLINKDSAVILDFQNEQLKKLLLECMTYSIYYSQLFKEANLTKEELLNAASVVDLLKRLPTLPKQYLKTKNIEIQNSCRANQYENFTSGTSGTPNKIYYDAESFQIGFALLRRFYDTMNLPTKFRSVRLSGKILIAPNQNKPPFWVYNIFDKQLFMSTYHLTEDNMVIYIDKLNKFKPQFIDAYPSAIYILAQYINKNKIKLGFTPIAIATTAETLYDNYRLEIEQAFGCKVYNQYSSSEGGPFIHECSNKKLHLNLDSGVFEFINLQGNEAKPGELAEMVITSLRQWKTPLIRYHTGDWVKVSKEGITFQHCTCGCYMPTIEEVIGRQEDILFTKEKGYIGRMDPAYKGLDGIIRSKIIQHTIDYIEVLNEVDNSTFSPAMLQLLTRNLRDRLGEQVQIEIKTVDNIPLGASGKFKAVERRFEL
jgi:phenylacetate-CoA ligase